MDRNCEGNLAKVHGEILNQKGLIFSGGSRSRA